jgi:hypothetical protein
VPGESPSPPLAHPISTLQIVVGLNPGYAPDLVAGEALGANALYKT